jgi:hypothetical protein
MIITGALRIWENKNKMDNQQINDWQLMMPLLVFHDF